MPLQPAWRGPVVPLAPWVWNPLLFSAQQLALCWLRCDCPVTASTCGFLPVADCFPQWAGAGLRPAHCCQWIGCFRLRVTPSWRQSGSGRMSDAGRHGAHAVMIPAVVADLCCRRRALSGWLQAGFPSPLVAQPVPVCARWQVAAGRCLVPMRRDWQGGGCPMALACAGCCHEYHCHRGFAGCCVV